MDVVGIERIEEEESGGGVTVPVGTVHGERGPAARAVRGAGNERRFFLLISCLIRLIHLLSLYREGFLTYK
jgi:hypothetical protein